jgi:hypothetical protein
MLTAQYGVRFSPEEKTSLLDSGSDTMKLCGKQQSATRRPSYKTRTYLEQFGMKYTPSPIHSQSILEVPGGFSDTEEPESLGHNGP